MGHTAHQVQSALSSLEPEHLKKLLAGIFVLLFLNSTIRAIYNVTLHPLARFPGPFWAGVTPWWRTYEEVWKGTSLFHKYKELHAKYGPVIRVSPNELTFCGPASAYDEIYNTKFDKDETWQKTLGSLHSTFGRPALADAKGRRELLLPFFSRRSILTLEHLVQEKTDTLISALLQQNENGIISDLHRAYSCYTMDIISDYCFAQSPSALSSPNFHAPIVEALMAVSASWCAMKHFPILQKINSLPTWLTIRLAPAMKGLIEYQSALQVQIKDLLANPEKLQSTSHPIIYETLLADDKEKGTPLNFMELDQEAQSVVAAGVDTTAVTLITGTYMLLRNPETATKLKQELKSAWPSLASTPPGLEILERLPYLSAVIKESLRMAPHISAGLPRVVPEGGTTIGGVFVPGGTLISLPVLFPHHDPTIFDSPSTFNPSRWLQSSKKTAELEQFLVPFSHGPRACLGRPLAYAELCFAFGNVFRRVELEMVETSEWNMEWKDRLVAQYPNGHLRAWARGVKE